jgi:hypothetical protein
MMMAAYVESLEAQIQASVNEFRKDGGPLGSSIKHLEAYLHVIVVFEQHFPNVQRQSALVTLLGFLEYQLGDLCSLYSTERELRIAPTDLRGSGVKRAVDYLIKVVGLELSSDSDVSKEVASIQRMRNVIVHNAGSFFDKRGVPLHHESRYVESRKDLSHENGKILIAHGYLRHVVETFDAYLQAIDHAVWREMGSEESGHAMAYGGKAVFDLIRATTGSAKDEIPTS